MQEAQKRAWESGIQAIFAGFISFAHLRNVCQSDLLASRVLIHVPKSLDLFSDQISSTTILGFWGTEQLLMVRPTLRGLLSDSYSYSDSDSNSNSDNVEADKVEDEDRVLQVVLWNVLRSPWNVGSVGGVYY